MEPPKDPWFVMGEYIPPPFGILALASARASGVIALSLARGTEDIEVCFQGTLLLDAPTSIWRVKLSLQA